MSDQDKDVKRDQARVPGAIKTRGRVLFMDDTEVVRSATCEVLGVLGYEVESAEEGERAIALYRKARDAGTPFDVVVLDLTVERGMGGRETIAGLLEIDPEVRIVISSGFPHDPVVAEYQKYGARAAIIKPYNSSELDKVLQQVLHD